MLCKNCNNPLEEGTKFCAICGAAVEESPDAAEVTEIAEIPEPEIIAENTTDPGKTFGLISLILGIASLVLTLGCSCCTCGSGMFGVALLGIIAFIGGAVVEALLSVGGIILGIVGSIKSKGAGIKNKLAIVGIILSAAALVVIVVIVIVYIVLVLVGGGALILLND